MTPTKRKTLYSATSICGLHTGNHKYMNGIRACIANPRRIMTAFGIGLVVIFVLNRIIPTSFLPTEDQGYFKVELELPEGATLERTRTVTNRAIEYIMNDPSVAYVQNVTGSSPRVGTNQARSELTVILKAWDEREDESIDDIMARIRGELEKYPESKVYLSTPPVIPGLGSSGGFEMQLEARGDATFDNLVQAVDTLMFYASQQKELAGLSSSLQAEIPQLYFNVDRDKVEVCRRTPHRRILHHESLHGLGLRQRLQHVQPHLPRIYSGRSLVPQVQGEPQPLLRPRKRQRHDTPHLAGRCLLHDRPGKHQALQHVQCGRNPRRSG